MIAGSRCPACDRVAVPPEDRCLACRAGTEATQLAAEGRVLTYTNQEGWIVLVELEAGARVLARVDEEPAIGDTLALEEDALVQAQP